MAGEAEKVAEVRELVLKGVDWDCEMKTLFREENQGLRQGVYSALNWFFDAEPYGIVLEDDCVPDLTFFRFCEEILERYKDDEQMMHIGCSNLAEDHTAGLEASYVFSRFSFVWGWAGWRRAWRKMSLDLEGLDEFEQSGAIRDFLDDPKAQAYMLDKFRVTQRRENNSWAYAWFYSILKNEGLCIVPKVNLVQNVGVGAEGATNTTVLNKKARLRAQPISFPLVHPKSRQPDPALERQFFYLSQKNRFRLWLWYMLHLLGWR
ncbi:MAG: nucleotide-diphospho-sugar transferase [Haliscomenobacteraceae bacterium CHB4]|nr:nucleotide-diphospho-sugar transferase [Haliscomenobacteraceae bacterium CHB4]